MRPDLQTHLVDGIVVAPLGGEGAHEQHLVSVLGVAHLDVRLVEAQPDSQTQALGFSTPKP